MRCDTMRPFVVLGVCARRSENLFVWFGAKPKQRFCARDIPRDRKWTREGRFQRRSREQLTKEDRKRQLKKQGRREQSVLDSSPGKDGQQREAVREDSQRWVGIPSGFVEVSSKIYAHDSLQMHGKLHKKCHTDSPFLHLELTQVHVCLFVLSSTLSVVFRVSVMKCVIPLVGNEKRKHLMNHWSWVVWFNSLR